MRPVKESMESGMLLMDFAGMISLFFFS